MAQNYSVDNAIAKFFGRLQGVSQQQCNELALSLTGPPLHPCQIQGAFSYTLYAGPGNPTIVQFRSEHLDMKVLKLARSIFGQLVATCIHYGEVGNRSRLGVYVMENLPGVTYIEARMAFRSLTDISEEMCLWHYNLVADLARFYALSWKRPLEMRERDIASCRNVIGLKLQLLSTSLPSRFTGLMAQLANDVGKLFSHSYPLVLTHNDLCEMNMLVDSETGHLTGVIDWAGADIQPFGLALWGIENVFGYMDGEGWHYFSHHKHLKELFWKRFEELAGAATITSDARESMKIARLVGIALRYGYRLSDEVTTEPISENDPSLRYLAAFLEADG